MRHLKWIFSFSFLIAVMVGVLGARTDRRLTGGFVNSFYRSTATGDTIYYMNKFAKGETVDPDSMYQARWWSFATGSGAANIHVYSPSIPGWTGYDDTTIAGVNWLLITIPAGGSWNSEGMPIYAFKYKSGSAGLQVIARD